MLAISIVREGKSPSGWAIQHTGEVREVFEKMTGGKSRFPLKFNPVLNALAPKEAHLVRSAVAHAWRDLPAVVITLED
mgnify:CR=1 FL=1